MIIIIMIIIIVILILIAIAILTPLSDRSLEPAGKLDQPSQLAFALVVLRRSGFKAYGVEGILDRRAVFAVSGRRLPSFLGLQTLMGPGLGLVEGLLGCEVLESFGSFWFPLVAQILSFHLLDRDKEPTAKGFRDAQALRGPFGGRARWA